MFFYNKFNKIFLIKNFISITIFCLWFAAIFDPIGNLLGIRYLALILLTFSLIILLINNIIILYKNSIQILFIFIYSFFLPLYGLIIYFFRGENGNFTDTSYIASGFLMLTSLIYFNKELCNFGIKFLLLSLRMLSIIILIIALNYTLSPENQWYSIFTEANVALISHRIYGNFQFPYIYFLASPMLIYLMSYDFNNILKNISIVNIFLFITSSVALILSGTRSHIIIGIIFVPLFFLITNIRKYYLYLCLSIFTLLILLIYIDSYSVAEEFFSTRETSNAIKIDMLTGYNDILFDPITMIFGQGFNAHEWSLPLKNIIAFEDGASKTELTYLEILRVYGLIIGTVILFTLINLVLSISRVKSNMIWLYPGLIIYLINASLNPYLFSTNGILPIALIIAILRYQTKSNPVFYKGT